MRQFVCCAMTMSILLASAMRLPAPVEEEATPKPPPKMRPAPAPKPKPKATPISFAGTWSGNTDSVCSNDGVHHTAPYTMTVASDERSLTSQVGDTAQQYPCSRNGDTLRSDYSNDVVTSTTIFRISHDGKTLSYSAKATITSWPMNGVVCTGSGTLTRQGR